MEKLLISACLMGTECKYSGGSNFIGEEKMAALREKYELVPICPETSGGLTTPRAPSERVGERVMNDRGEDVTAQYLRGAELACEAAKKHGAALALLKEKSPSCGSGAIYDGTFSHTVIPGDGVTAEMLKAMGVKICGETEISKLL